MAHSQYIGIRSMYVYLDGVGAAQQRQVAFCGRSAVLPGACGIILY
jgi:hypothetical protein